MKKISGVIIVVWILTLSVSCRKEGTWGVKGEGANETEVRSVNAFNGIKLGTDAEVYYVKDSVYKVEVNAQNNIRGILTTEVQSGDLVIEMKREVWKSNNITVTVHAPHMNRLLICGSGNINSTGVIIERDLSLTISGSGNISVPTLSVQTLTTRVSGSGCVKTENGNVDNAYHSITGSGNLGLEYVKSANVEANISGSGNIALTALNKLNATISGSGNVRYHGNPAVNANINGSGRIVALD